MEQMDPQHEDLKLDELSTAKEERRRELEQLFGSFHFKVVRKELFAHQRDPAVVIRYGSITFNAACINELEDVIYVQLLLSEEDQKLAVTGCGENDKDALRWCIAKPDKRKSRKMTCPDFTKELYKKFNWDEKCRYKILGYKVDFDGETYYVFDLAVKETFHEKPKKGEETDEPVDTRKGYYSEDIAGTFGVPLEEHRKQTQITEENGFVNIGMLTGARKPKDQQSALLPDVAAATEDESIREAPLDE